MPIYSYRCPACYHTEDRIVAHGERDNQTCRQLIARSDHTEEECGAKLERHMEDEQVAKTPYSWK
jgi:predicted nucleic acid-binding Zn ribbon protein